MAERKINGPDVVEGAAASGSDQEPAPAVPATSPDAAPALALVCIHCGGELTPHNDVVGSLHCYSKDCNDCCFLSPDGDSEGQIREKMERRYCASRKA